MKLSRTFLPNIVFKSKHSYVLHCTSFLSEVDQ